MAQGPTEHEGDSQLDGWEKVPPSPATAFRRALGPDAKTPAKGEAIGC